MANKPGLAGRISVRVGLFVNGLRRFINGSRRFEKTVMTLFTKESEDFRTKASESLMFTRMCTGQK